MQPLLNQTKVNGKNVILYVSQHSPITNLIFKSQLQICNTHLNVFFGFSVVIGKSKKKKRNKTNLDAVAYMNSMWNPTLENG